MKSVGSVSVGDGSRSGTNKRGSGLFTSQGGARLSPWFVWLWLFEPVWLFCGDSDMIRRCLRDEQYSAEGFSLKDLIDKGEICEVRCHIRYGLNGPCVFNSEMVKECWAYLVTRRRNEFSSLSFSQLAKRVCYKRE